MVRRIGATYRLQLGPDLTFADVQRDLDYFVELGVSELYLSPLLQARAGSTHGYDVVDPTRVSDDLGGEPGLRALAEAAHAAGLGVVVDIVPNHVGTGSDNPLWELLLAEGRGGEGGRVFDVDWMHPLPTAENKVIVPVLGDQYGEVLHRGELTLYDDGGTPRLRYHDHTFPLSPDSREAVARAGGVDVVNGRPGEPETWSRLHGLLENQHYRLVYWRVGDRLINYRRFFAIDDLASVRVDDEHVFDLTHGTIIRLVREGVIDGLRIDHPDGLRDPQRYLRRLRGETGGVWTVVEKITHPRSSGGSEPPDTPRELLPYDWQAEGTTGYEFANDVVGLFVDARAEALFDELDAEMDGDTRPYAEQAVAAKLEILGTDLYADVQRLARRFWALCQQHLHVRDIDEPSAYEVVARMLVHLPVYRTYVDPETGEAHEQDVEYVQHALDMARVGATAHDRLYVLLANALLGRAGTDPTHLAFLARFQQLSGALTAKGVEDTLFYRYRRMLALNEVGGDPTSFGISADEFHRRNAVRAQRHPAGLNTTATHDTKRGEDIRLRIAALTEIADRWAKSVRDWRGRASDAGVDLPMANLVFQTLAGLWPSAGDGLRGRAVEYVHKAAREAGERTGWVSPDEDYESLLASFVDGLLSDETFRAEMDEVSGAANEIAMVSGLAQVLLRTFAPGVPDVYQGAELWHDALVDPDNRRPVDFSLRADLLRSLDGASPADLWGERGDGRVKLWVLRTALRVRRDHPAFVDASSGYKALVSGGALAGHVVAFARTDESAAPGLIAIAPRLPGAVMGPELDTPTGDRWRDTTVDLPEGQWTDAFTGTRLAGGTVGLADVMTILPVALLTR